MIGEASRLFHAFAPGFGLGALLCVFSGRAPLLLTIGKVKMLARGLAAGTAFGLARYFS